MGSSAIFFNTSSCEPGIPTNSDQFNLEPIDPLQEIGTEGQDIYYRLDSVVFAEPLGYNFNQSDSLKDAENPSKHQDNIIAIDKVLVQNRTGRKYKKYHINIEDTTELCCPQSHCKRKFSTIKLLKAHIRKVHCADKFAFVCEVCGAMFSSRYLLVRHSAVHRGRIVRCTICDMVLRERTSLSTHLRTHSGIKPHTCATCNRQFTRKSTLDTHVKFVHRGDQLPCPKCPDRFETRTQLMRHAATHQRAKQDGAQGS